MAWLDPSTADDLALVKSVWRDADLLAPEVIAAFLGAAEESCSAYAPALAEGETFPDGWRLAQAMQARNIFNAAQASGDGTNDGSDFGVRAFPLDWMVKQLLRPESGVGAIW